MKEHIQLKHALYDQVGKIGRALGQQTRLEIVEILAQAPAMSKPLPAFSKPTCEV